MNLLSKIRHLGKRLLLGLGFYKYPDFIIIGAQKAGTTYLYSLLRQHPQIIEPVNKEAHFFDYDFNYRKGRFRYKLNFNLSFRFNNGQKTFEATPDYISHKETPKRIKQLLPTVKIIVLLREPISRAYSGWKMHHYAFKEKEKYKWLHDPRKFEDVVEKAISERDDWHTMNHVGKGLYGQQIENFLKYFDKEQMLFLYQKDLKENTQITFNKVAAFVGINAMSISEINKKDTRFWSNKSERPDLKVNDNLKQKLESFYKNDKEKLKQLIGKDLPW